MVDRLPARILCASILALAAACGSSTKTPTAPTSTAVRLETVFVSRHFDAAHMPVYEAWATVIAAGSAATVLDATVTLSGGAPSPLTYRDPRVVPVPAGGNRVLQLTFPDRPDNPLYTNFQITLTIDDGAGHRGPAEASGAVKDFPIPDLTASADRTTLAAGETTTLRWRATGSTSVNIAQFASGPILPAEGSIEATPCPGVTVFDVRTQNPSGEGHVPITITVGGPPQTPWFCGTWSGPSTETWTDSGGAPGTWSGGVTVVAFQSGGRVTGQFVRNLQLNGRLARPLEAAAGPGGSLIGTVPTDRFEPGPRFGCPVTIDARLSPDAMTLSGTFAGRCTLDGSREVSLQGRFEATRHSNPYPSPVY